MSHKHTERHTKPKTHTNHELGKLGVQHTFDR